MPILREVRQTARAMSKQPLFAAVAILTLGLGIGANTAIFSVVHTVLLDPVPYPAEHPERVMVLNEKSRSWDSISVAYPNFMDWQRLNHSFESMAGFRESRFNFTGLEEPLRLSVTEVSYEYFGILGVSAAPGRLFDEAEDRAEAPAVLVLNHRLWTSRFGADPRVIGKVVRLDDAPYTIIGVLPEDFETSSEERAFTTLEPWAQRNESAQDRGNHQGIYVLARVREGVRFDEARSEMETIARQLEQEYPNSNSGIGITMKRLSDRRVEDYEATLWTLLGAVSLVLLIACANVANLLLARAVSRKRVTAIQSALGASRLRLVRQGLTEGLLLSVAGGLLGVIAYSVARRTREIGLRMSVGANRANVFRLVVSQGIGWSLLGAASGLAATAGASRLLASFLFGVNARDPFTFLFVPVLLLLVAFVASAVPALAATRIDPIRALRYE